MRLPAQWNNIEIIDEIGSGSYGTVYEAEDTVDGSSCAVKVIHIPQDDSEREYIRKTYGDTAREYYAGLVKELDAEIMLLEALHENKNVVRILDYVVEPETEDLGWYIYIRMELLEELTSINFDEDKVIRLGLDICGALEECERQHIVHRDLKPDNILVTEAGGFKLSDFGIAKRLDKTSTNTIKGTFKYMAPELYTGSAYNGQVDIYSLGLIMYQLVNRGREPFVPVEKGMVSFSDLEEALHRRMKGEALPRPVDASEGLSEIILKACAFATDKRYKTAGQMRADLQRLRAGTYKVRRKLVQKKQEISYEKKKTIRRTSLLTAAVFACILGIALGAFYIWNSRTFTQSDGSGTDANMAETALPTGTPIAEEEQEPPVPEAEYLAASDLITDQDVFAYHYCQAVNGTYYRDAIGGMTKDIDNVWTVDLTSLDGTYPYLDGIALVNADYADVYTQDDNYAQVSLDGVSLKEGDDTEVYAWDQNYIRISLDGEKVYEFSPKQGASSEYTEEFHLPLGEAKTLEICIKGATTMRLADLAFTNSEGCYTTAMDTDPFSNPLEKLELVGKGTDGDLRVMCAERDEECKERNFVLAGTASQADNIRKYKINGAVRFTGTVFRNYNFPSETADDSVGVSIYLDDKLYSSYNENNPSMDVPLEGKETLTIVINGCNYYRIADYAVEDVSTAVSAATEEKKAASSKTGQYLAASDLDMGQDVFAYHYCQDISGTYYEDAIGGMTKDVDNIWTIDLTSLDRIYAYLDGIALINADYADIYTRDQTYVRISLDGEEVYEFSPKQGESSEYTNEFHLPLDQAKTLEICIKGATTMRLADLAFTNTKGCYSTAAETVSFSDPLEKLELVDKGAEGDLRIMTAERDIEGTEKNFVLAGTNSQAENSRTYRIYGASRFTGIVFRNYNFPEKNADDATGVSIYLDGKLYGTYNEDNPELDVPLDGKKTMQIVINGCNYYRIADYDVELI